MPLSHTPLILIVDDEPTNLALMRRILGKEYKLIFATNGADALALVQQQAPSLLLLDVQMPGMSGYEVLQHLRESPATRDLPVIFITALNDPESHVTGLELGGVDYITKPVVPRLLQARIQTHLKLVRASRLEESYVEAIQMLGEAGHYNDSDTGMHIWRMAGFAGALAHAAGWSKEEARRLELAAPMHDMGKIAIPEAVLRKPGALDAEEWKIMKTHPRLGYQILSRSKSALFQLAAEIALRHHEKWDGSGYPDGLAGTNIPESARIVAVADVFDALTMKRPYKEPWPLDKTMDTIRNSAGSHLDPHIVALLEAHLPEILAIKRKWDQRE